MTEDAPHESSLLMNVANTLCRKDSPHEGQRVVIWDENDNLVEETPPCEEHIRIADLARWPLSIAFGMGLQHGYMLGAGEDMPLNQLFNSRSPYRHGAYRDDFNNFKFEEQDQ